MFKKGNKVIHTSTASKTRRQTRGIFDQYISIGPNSGKYAMIKLSKFAKLLCHESELEFREKRN